MVSRFPTFGLVLLVPSAQPMPSGHCPSWTVAAADACQRAGTRPVVPFWRGGGGDRYVVDHITVILWRIWLCGIAYSSGGVLAIFPLFTPHNLGVRLSGELSVSLISRRFDYV